MKVDNSLFLIGRIKEFYTSYLEGELKKRGLNSLVTSHADIIAVLGMNGEMTMSEVAERINRDRSTVTALVAKLRKNGYVRQRKNEEDGRSSFLSLTEKGHRLTPEFMSISSALFDRAKTGISENEWKSFKDVLLKVYENLA